jgi:ferrochelatase
METGIVLVNFGGPRSCDEVEAFLKTLLCDQDVVRTPFPPWIHNFIFKKVAKKRAVKVSKDYEEIGGKSPIFFDTENLRAFLEKKLECSVFTFHRYLPETFNEFIKQIEAFKGSRLIVFPLFPQFSYATTGSCARFFKENLCRDTLQKMVWIPSYPNHKAFIDAFKNNICETLKNHQLDEKDCTLFYSFHGVPKKFICFDDPYLQQCSLGFEALKKHFPKADHLMAFQSKFGKGEWLKPYTSSIVEEDFSVIKTKNVLFVPLSFTSDHIETLGEIENEYMEPLKQKGFNALRVSCLQNDFNWVLDVLNTSSNFTSTSMLVRQEEKTCCQKNHKNCCACK